MTTSGKLFQVLQGPAEENDQSPTVTKLERTLRRLHCVTVQQLVQLQWPTAFWSGIIYPIE